MELVNEQVVYFDFSLINEEWDFVEISLPFIPRIGETCNVDEYMDANQVVEHKRILNRNPNLSTDFMIKSINHLFMGNVQHTTIFLDFFEIPKKSIPFKLAYQ